MIITRDLGDIMDRWSIAKLKSERIGTEENKKEYESFSRYIEEKKKQHPSVNIEDFCDLILKVNDFIWQLESGLKSGKESLKNPIYLFDKENQTALANIGTATILIRNFNSVRVNIKNLVNKIVGEGFEDTKSAHLSQ